MVYEKFSKLVRAKTSVRLYNVDKLVSVQTFYKFSKPKYQYKIIIQ